MGYTLPNGGFPWSQGQTPPQIPSLVDMESDLNAGIVTVSESELADGAVTESKIADLAVTSAKIGTGAVGTNKIGDAQVTTEKLAAEAVTPGKIAPLAVETAGINNAAVTTAKIADGAITEAKLDPSITIPGGGGGTSYFDVTDYGADATGATDCSQAFNDALVALINTSAKGTIFFPKGTFLFTNPVSMFISDVVIAGEGPGVSTILRGNGSTMSHIISCGNTSAGAESLSLSGVEVRDLTFDGNKANNSQSADPDESLLYMYNCGNYRVDNCEFKNAVRHGLHEFSPDLAAGNLSLSGNNQDCIVTRVNAHDNDGHGVYLSGPWSGMYDGITSRGNGQAGLFAFGKKFEQSGQSGDEQTRRSRYCTFANIRAESNGEQGLKIQSLDTTTMVNVSAILNGGQGIQFAAEPGFLFNQGRNSGTYSNINLFSNMTNTLLFGFAQFDASNSLGLNENCLLDATFSNVTIIGSNAMNDDAWGFHMEICSNVTFNGLTISNNGSTGMTLSNVSGCNFSGLRILDNGQNDPGAEDSGIVFLGACTNNSFNQVALSNSGTSTSGNGFEIQVVPGADLTGTRFTNIERLAPFSTGQELSLPLANYDQVAFLGLPDGIAPSTPVAASITLPAYGQVLNIDGPGSVQTITPAWVGRRVVLTVDGAGFTLTHGTGNIDAFGGSDVIVAGNRAAELVMKSDGRWSVLTE